MDSVNLILQWGPNGDDNDYGTKISQTTFNLIMNLIARDELGQKKYGTTLDREDLTKSDWLKHLQEELLDGAGYIECILRS